MPSEVEEALTGGGSAHFSGAGGGAHGLSSPVQRRLQEQPAPVSPLVERCVLQRLGGLGFNSEGSDVLGFSIHVRYALQRGA